MMSILFSGLTTIDEHTVHVRSGMIHFMCSVIAEIIIVQHGILLNQ